MTHGILVVYLEFASDSKNQCKKISTMLNQESPTKNNDGYTSYWPTVRIITFVLLALWLLLNFGVIFYARELSSLQLFGWPIPFYMAAQGTILIYLLIIGGYALLVNRLERKLAHANESKGGNGSA